MRLELGYLVSPVESLQVPVSRDYASARERVVRRTLKKRKIRPQLVPHFVAVSNRRHLGASCYIKEDPLPGALNKSSAIYGAVKWEIKFQPAGFEYRLSRNKQIEMVAVSGQRFRKPRGRRRCLATCAS